MHFMYKICQTVGAICITTNQSISRFFWISLLAVFCYLAQPALRLRPRPQKTPREARATACLNKLAQASLPGVQGLQVSAAASRRAARGARCSFYCSCHPDEVQSQGRANVKYASAHVTSVLSSFSKCEKLPGFLYARRPFAKWPLLACYAYIRLFTLFYLKFGKICWRKKEKRSF